MDRGATTQLVQQMLGHQGRTSTSRAFVESVDPEVVFYQASEGNQYGHPHEEAVANATTTGAELYGTDRHGTITFVTDGTEYEVMAQRGAARAPPPRPDRPARTTGDDCININTASKEELQEIIHIGPARAEQIIELRRQRPFTDLSSLTRVRGIGPARVDDIDEEGVACG